MKALTLILAFIASIHNSYAMPLAGHGIQLDIPQSWALNSFREYSSINDVMEWVYKVDDATMIVTKTKCSHCKEISQENADEFNFHKEFSTSALLINLNGINALYTVYESPKQVFTRTLTINIEGYQYGIQQSMSTDVPFVRASHMERLFFSIINSFKIND